MDSKNNAKSRKKIRIENWQIGATLFDESCTFEREEK